MSKVIFANYVENGIKKNERFNLDSKLNRDNSNYPYYLLKKKLLNYGIILNTPDINIGKKIAFELHLNASKIKQNTQSYLLQLETEDIWPKNSKKFIFKDYKKIFTWNDNITDNQKFIKINFPNKFSYTIENNKYFRNRMVCLIASNKIMNNGSMNELYSERIKTIRWFEKNTLNKFHLYGVNWDIELSTNCRTTKKYFYKIFQRKVNKIFGINPFPSYCGTIINKTDTLSKYLFSICYENMSNYHGYITEKIWDCFFAGTIPIYWGASNVSEYIPSKCYIDRRSFDGNSDLYNYLQNISDNEILEKQNAIQKFLLSEEARYFSSEYFANKISEVIVNDIKIY